MTINRSPYPTPSDPPTNLSARQGCGEPDNDESVGSTGHVTADGLGWIGQSPRADALVAEYHRQANERSNVSHPPAPDTGPNRRPPTSPGIPTRARETRPPTWPSTKGRSSTSEGSSPSTATYG